MEHTLKPKMTVGDYQQMLDDTAKTVDGIDPQEVKRVNGIIQAVRNLFAGKENPDKEIVGDEMVEPMILKEIAGLKKLQPVSIGESNDN